VPDIQSQLTTPRLLKGAHGYWYLGRPTLDELRMDLRAMMRIVRPDFEGPIG